MSTQDPLLDSQALTLLAYIHAGKTIQALNMIATMSDESLKAAQTIVVKDLEKEQQLQLEAEFAKILKETIATDWTTQNEIVVRIHSGSTVITLQKVNEGEKTETILIKDGIESEPVKTIRRYTFIGTHSSILNTTKKVSGSVMSTTEHTKDAQGFKKYVVSNTVLLSYPNETTPLPIQGVEIETKLNVSIQNTACQCRKNCDHPPQLKVVTVPKITMLINDVEQKIVPENICVQ